MARPVDCFVSIFQDSLFFILPQLKNFPACRKSVAWQKVCHEVKIFYSSSIVILTFLPLSSMVGVTKKEAENYSACFPPRLGQQLITSNVQKKCFSSGNARVCKQGWMTTAAE